MSTTTRPAPLETAEDTLRGAAARPGEPPWAALVGGGVAVLAGIGVWIAAFAPDSTVPVPSVAYTGNIGPAGLVVTATPLKAGAGAQSLTIDLTRRRTGAPYEVAKSVSVRLTPPPAAGATAGGPTRPLKATAAAPGKWLVTLPAGQGIAASGTWTLKVSASLRPGQAFKQTVPLAYR